MPSNLADLSEFQFLSLNQIKDLTGKSTSTLYRWIYQKRFPPPEPIGPNSVAWRVPVFKEWQRDPMNWQPTK